MKQSRLVLAAVIVAALGTTAVLAYACSDKDKAASATTASAQSGCAAKGASATTAAVTASYGSCAAMKASAVTAQHGACGASKTSAVTASAGGACGASKTSAVTASAGDACCASKASAKTAVAKAASSAPGKVDAVFTGGGSCSSHGAAKGTMAKGDCDGCDDMAFCEGELKDASASVQIVPLKNGVMYVYTAAGPSKVQAVQAAMTRRTDRMNAMLASGDKSKLCPECKLMRGAMASGKLQREMINIEGGCLTLMTSTDAAIVNKLHAMASSKHGATTKS
jgi:hypothetical protein